MRHKSLLKSAQQEAPLPVLDRPPHPQQSSRFLPHCGASLSFLPDIGVSGQTGVVSWTRQRGDSKVIHAGFFLLRVFQTLFYVLLVNTNSFWNTYLKISKCCPHPARSWFWVTEKNRVEEWDRWLIFLMTDLYKEWDEKVKSFLFTEGQCATLQICPSHTFYSKQESTERLR